jgi:SusD family/CarboxypepD_reg-like domain
MFNIPLIHKKIGMCIMFVMISYCVNAQSGISGKVLAGMDGKPLGGAIVNVKKSAVNQITAADGTFTINAKPGDILVVTHVGFLTQEVPVNSQGPFTISLVPSENSLDEVIVIGYSGQRKKGITGSVSVVVVKALKSIPAGSAMQPGAGTAINFNMIRFADVLLWAAEVEVETGSLAKAEEYVNKVRERAANPQGWAYTYKDNTDPLKGVTTTPAANYKISLYNGQFAAQGQNYAREAVRFERKLELAMEGHRVFDLQRWDAGTGYMQTQLNNYIAATNNYWKSILVNGTPLSYEILKGATFHKGRNEIFPIPQRQIDLSFKDGQSVLKQNPGY